MSSVESLVQRLSAEVAAAAERVPLLQAMAARYACGQEQRFECFVALTEQRGKMPVRVPASDLEHLKTEKKLIMDAIKIAAYQVETELFGMLGEHYARSADEGRTLLHAAFQSSADLEVAEGEHRRKFTRWRCVHRANRPMQLANFSLCVRSHPPSTLQNLGVADFGRNHRPGAETAWCKVPQDKKNPE